MNVTNEPFNFFLNRFVLKHLPGNISNSEIEDMINTVDKNQDGKISYSEFRVSSCHYPTCSTADVWL